VKRTEHIVAGAPRCAYEVSASSVGAQSL
jgi:hypothetical protein